MHEIIGRYVEIDGAAAYYESCGEGRDLLLIHTAGRDNRQWHGVAHRLAPHFKLWAPDLPARGKSAPLPGNRCIDDVHDFARWLKLFLETVGVREFAVLGSVMGGNIALLMAALYPEVRAVATLQGGDYTPSLSETALDLITHPQNSLMHSNMDFTLSLVGSQSRPEGMEISAWSVLSLIPVTQQADLRAFNRTDTRALMAQVRAPVLLVHGVEDWIVTQAMQHATRERLVNAHARYVPLTGLGHFPHIEDPDRTADAVIPFFLEHDQSSSQ